MTDEDVDELKACIELGFGFDSPAGPDRSKKKERERRSEGGSDTMIFILTYIERARNTFATF